MIDSPETIHISVVVGQVCPEMFWKREREKQEQEAGELQERVGVREMDKYGCREQERRGSIKNHEMKLGHLITQPVQSKKLSINLRTLH